MDFQISPDDRVGAQVKPARGRAAKPAKKSARGGRVEPQLGNIDSVYVDEPVPAGRGRNRGRPAGTKRGRTRRERQPLTFGRIVFRLFYWLFVLGIWAGIAAAAVVVYFAVQLPSSDTWAVPDRPPNIRILSASGQLISNRGKTGGEAVS